MNKLNVILDTDTYNECDDQFALAYLLKYQDRFNKKQLQLHLFIKEIYQLKLGLIRVMMRLLRFVIGLILRLTKKYLKVQLDIWEMDIKNVMMQLIKL
ncbi:MAG: hypothetical protein HFJ25_00855 [Clostridia bacterium]|jgi:hypothetical protein|nr:hypothetical protein [Clostridia bacterium]